MNLIPNPKILLNAALLIASGVFSTIGYAHSAGATTDSSGMNASATILAVISCFDEGKGEPEGLFAQVRDLSDPEPGLFVSIQLYKDGKAANDTDTVSGDADYSDGIQLNAGRGAYQISVNKTKAGPRKFDVIWDCMTEKHIPTASDILLQQFQ